MQKKNNKHSGGRKLKAEPAKHICTFRLTDKEKLAFEKLVESSGLKQNSRFIKSLLFNKHIKIVKIDKGAIDYYVRLTHFYHQFQAIGNNYNQTVKAIKSNFGEKRGLGMLHRLEKNTIELIVLSKKIIELTREYEEKWLQK